MELLIREKRITDLMDLLELFRAGDELHFSAHPELFQDCGDDFRRQYVHNLLTSHNTNFFIAENQGEILGFISVMVREAIPLPVLTPRRYGVIENIVVKAQHRQKGVAHALLAQADEWLKAQGIYEVELNVYFFNQPAKALYEKEGYTPVSQKMHKSLK